MLECVDFTHLNIISNCHMYCLAEKQNTLEIERVRKVLEFYYI